jgi:hypothetical protein
VGGGGGAGAPPGRLSWGFDGATEAPFTVANGGVQKPFGARCSDGTSFFVCVDIEAGCIAYGRGGDFSSGKKWGFAYEGVAGLQEGILPIFSASSSTDLSIRVGDKDHPFSCKPPPGYRALWEAYAPAHCSGLQGGSWVAGFRPDGAAAPQAVVRRIGKEGEEDGEGEQVAGGIRVFLPGEEAEALPASMLQDALPIACARGASHGIVLTQGGFALSWGGGEGGACAAMGLGGWLWQRTSRRPAACCPRAVP